MVLTIKVPSKVVQENILSFFLEKIRHDMKCQTLFSLKIIKKIFQKSSNAVVIEALRLQFSFENIA